MPCCNKQREDDGTKADTEDSVNQEPSEEAEHDIGPGIPSIECHVFASIKVKVTLNCVLKSSRIVITEVAAWNDKRNRVE